MGTKASSAQGRTCSEWPGWEGRPGRGGCGARPGSFRAGRLAETLDCSCGLDWKKERQAQSTYQLAAASDSFPCLLPVQRVPVGRSVMWSLVPAPGVFSARDLLSVADQTSSWARGGTSRRSTSGPACANAEPLRPHLSATCHPALSLCPRGLCTQAVALPKAVQLTTGKGTRCLGLCLDSGRATSDSLNLQ